MNQEDERSAKLKMIENNSNALLETVLLRINSFTIISGLSTAFLGMAASTLASSIKTNTCLLYTSILSLLLISILSLGIFIFSNRRNIKDLSARIKDIPNWDLSKPLPQKKLKNTYEIELLYILFIISLLIFVSSFIF